MKTDAPNIPYQNIQRGSSSIGYLVKLNTFLDAYLPEFTKDRKVSSSQNENDITELLYKHLTRKRKFNREKIEFPFEFQPEKSQKKVGTKGHAKRVDLAIRINAQDCDMEVIYVLEAKKLPTGAGEREQEYVRGKGGGIQRFKDDNHGLDDVGKLLPQSGIVAYLITNEFSFWQNQINEWIDDCKWNKSEHLEKEYFREIGKLNSTHLRVSGANVQLNHYWIKIK